MMTMTMATMATTRIHKMLPYDVDDSGSDVTGG
jgi:hypothetical protein